MGGLTRMKPLKPFSRPVLWRGKTFRLSHLAGDVVDGHRTAGRHRRAARQLRGIRRLVRTGRTGRAINPSSEKTSRANKKLAIFVLKIVVSFLLISGATHDESNHLAAP